MAQQQTASGTGGENPDRTRLRDHFASNPSDGSRWNDLWTQGYKPWDKGSPSPSLIDLLNSKPESLPFMTDGSLTNGDRRLKALVPGCGKGYDVFLLASWGFDATGLEISEVAAGEAEIEGRRIDAVVQKGEDPDYALKSDIVHGRKWKIARGDFFVDSWASEGPFDVIYDYTFFCALPPKIRHKWAARMAHLLAPKGRLICLEFPTYKDPATEGPPWAVRPNEYVAYLSKPGEQVQYDANGFVEGIDENDPARSSQGLVREAHFQPSRTHPIGKDTDWISIWRHQ